MRTITLKARASAFTLIELLVIAGVGLVLLVVILGLLLPRFANPPKSDRIMCVHNLKDVGLAFRIYATDHEDRFPMQVSTNQDGLLELSKGDDLLWYFRSLSNELRNPKIIFCPSDKKRKPATSFAALQRANVSYFVGLDATEYQPQSFLAGDRNLTTNGSPLKPGRVELTTDSIVGWTEEMHNLQGNIVMGDGSVQQFSASRLAQALRSTSCATNLLAVP